jgi:cytochrome c-type biogenesis protein CcmF
VSIGLIGWRGDRLRSPGVIDSPISREGAFLANNVLFSVFAFVVLLGTVFPLVVEAVRNEKLSVGAPFFERMTLPLGLALLTLMAIAPVLPWRKASGELLRHRLLWPAWIGVASLLVAALLGARGIGSLLAFGLGGFAAGSALRQLVLATRRQGLRGLVGRANGGMVVHLGVIIIAVAFAASSGYSQRAEFRVTPGQTVEFGGHTFTFLGTRDVTYPEKFSRKADIRIDGGPIYSPAVQRFNNQGTFVPTPSVKTGLRSDIYLTYTPAPTDGDHARRTGCDGYRRTHLVRCAWIGVYDISITPFAPYPGSQLFSDLQAAGRVPMEARRRHRFGPTAQACLVRHD